MSKKSAAPALPSYVALTRLWHTKELRHVEAGEPVDLSHLDAEQIQRLIDSQAVGIETEVVLPAPASPIGDPKPETQEATNGTNDGRN